MADCDTCAELRAAVEAAYAAADKVSAAKWALEDAEHAQLKADRKVAQLRSLFTGAAL